MNTNKTKSSEKVINSLDYTKIIKELDECNNPFFLFDDDPDGLSSFLQLYAYKKSGEGIIVKSAPMVPFSYSKKLMESREIDKIFILDKPDIQYEFLDQLRNISIVWIDHHESKKEFLKENNFNNVEYFNPRNYEENIPTSQVCYFAIEQSLLKNHDKDNSSTCKSDLLKKYQWKAAVGIIGDWVIPSFINELSKNYPDLISSQIKKPEEALFKTTFGKLIKIISFNLKGTSKEVKKSIEFLKKIESPYEILNRKPPYGKYIYGRYFKLNEEYTFHLKNALSNKDNEFIVYIYDSQNSFTGDLSNECLFLNPNKIIIIGKEKRGYLRLSLRSAKYNLSELLNIALKGIRGHGGGHEHACGAHIYVDDFNKFLDQLKEAIDLFQKNSTKNLAS